MREVSDELASDRLLGVVADVTSEEDTERYYAAAIERFGRVDGLHANAGIAEPGPTWPRPASTRMTARWR